MAKALLKSHDKQHHTTYRAIRRLGIAHWDPYLVAGKFADFAVVVVEVVEQVLKFHLAAVAQKLSPEDFAPHPVVVVGSIAVVLAAYESGSAAGP